ncbi:DUF5691 domain-containing protein [Streptomyces sp. XM4193]|uniref:DUF5691 domain-containing protein n=1 Tax=Streptomyces sp. XM4193 TaxID=2929782 RepID=UPI001FF74423|nr:DUF5691 domain-containing protein [Streptomyces sp. XM4193]MCK1795523.1 DUF5691 domain-containing protein [Streptomyces sp. XM4193]
MTTEKQTPIGAVPEVAWEELVTAALLGEERRPPPGGSAAALLDLAAVSTVRQRAGLRPAQAGPRPEPAPHDPRSKLPPAAARRLGQFLSRSSRGGYRAASGAGSHGATRQSPDLGELLPEWLAIANSRGFGAPSALLPQLLDAARARTDLRSEVLTFAGPRAPWLAGLNPDWRFALRGGALPRDPRAMPDGPEPTDEVACPEPAVDEQSVRQLWEEGLFAERVSLLTAVRRRDPAAGRELLLTTWSTERAEDRLMFLDSLRRGLSTADEPFLDRALGDRSKNVRTTAAELLATLPESALARRMWERASGCVGLGPADGAAAEGAVDGVADGSSARLAVEPPRECDAAMVRDGVVATPPKGRGKRSWWLVQTVESAPLSRWTAHLGGRSPAEILALPVADGWRDELHAAWAWAAVRQRDTAWAEALLGLPVRPGGEIPGDPARLLAVLPQQDRARWAAGFVSAHGLADAFRVLGTCSVPWPAELAKAVMDALEIAREAGSYPWSFSGVLGLAERSLDPSLAEQFVPLATRRGGSEAEDGARPGAAAYWSDAFDRLVLTLRIRATMREELEQPGPSPAG